MKKIVKLTESDLLKIVKRVIAEQEGEENTTPYSKSPNQGKPFADIIDAEQLKKLQTELDQKFKGKTLYLYTKNIECYQQKDINDEIRTTTLNTEDLVDTKPFKIVSVTPFTQETKTSNRIDTFRNGYDIAVEVKCESTRVGTEFQGQTIASSVETEPILYYAFSFDGYPQIRTSGDGYNGCVKDAMWRILSSVRSVKKVETDFSDVAKKGTTGYPTA
jgi:hypothetical protein